MKRILVLNYEFPPLGGGGGAAAKTIAKGYIEQGYEVDYLTTRFSNFKKVENIDGINVYRVWVPGRSQLATATMISLLLFPFAALLQGARLCSKYKYDFIHTHFVVPTGPLGWVLSKIFCIPHIISIHGGDVYDPTKKSSPHKHWYYRLLIKFLFNSARAVVAESENIKNSAVTYYKPAKEITVLPHPYEIYTFAPATRTALGLSDDVLYTVSVGRLIKRKGFDFLLQSMVKIADSKVHALIIGDGPERDTLVSLAQDLGISDRVHLLGYLSDEKKFQYLSVADVFILSSIHEGFGIVLQEAMQVGLPLIATDIGGQTDLVTEGVNGHLIPYGDSEKMARTIETTLHEAVSYKDSNMRKVHSYKPEVIAAGYILLAHG